MVEENKKQDKERKDTEEKKMEKEQAKKEMKISRKKIEIVQKLVNLIKDSNTVIIASIKNLPSRQFQDIRKKLRGEAQVKVVKKRIILRAIDESGKLEELKRYVQEDSAVLFSKKDAFDLATLLAENKNLIKARVGQEAIEDIEIEEGPTDLIPGPAISELGALSIKIAVEEGKIAIKERKVIVKAGEKISEAAASIMSKLDIKPFKIGLEPLAIYDAKTGKIYIGVKIDKEAAVENLKTAAGKSLRFAQKIAYYCKETIGFLLRKANVNAGALKKLQLKEEKKEDEKAEESKEEKQEQEKKMGEKKEEKENAEEKKENSAQQNQENKSQEEK